MSFWRGLTVCLLANVIDVIQEDQRRNWSKIHLRSACICLSWSEKKPISTLAQRFICRAKVLLLSTMVFLQVSVFVLTILVIEAYKFKFQTLAFGKEFRPSDPNNLISSENNVRSLTKCVMMCSANEDCQTVDFNTVSLRCRLFAEWYYEGTTVSSSPTSLIAFIVPKSSFDLLYNQSCLVSSEYSRFLACENGRWTCQSNFFWNGSTCERKRSFDQSCRTDEWCNSNRFLFCLNVTARCACNHSMTWNASQCSPSTSLQLFVATRMCDFHCFSLSGWASRHNFWWSLEWHIHSRLADPQRICWIRME